MSPLPDVDPFSGDVVYSQALLEAPPPGWTYVPYVEALRSGDLREHARRSAIDVAEGPWGRGRALVTVAREHAINALRDRNALFREPFRFLEIRGTFDLVHCHTYSVRWTGVPTPVVVSNAVPLRELYARARNWGARRVDAADRIDRSLARALGVDHIEYGLGRVDRVLAFTQTLADWYKNVGVPPDHLGVVPCFPATIDQVGRRRPVAGRVGFVGSTFVAKGGPAALAAMELVRDHRPDAHLVIAGGGAAVGEAELARSGATAVGYLPRRELLADFFPSCSVFCYPSGFDGLPLTLVEALATGLPSVVSRYFALPEIVGDGGVAVPSDDPSRLARALLELLDPRVNDRFSAAALARYRATYAPDVVRPQLAENYELAIAVAAGRIRGGTR